MSRWRANGAQPHDRATVATLSPGRSVWGMMGLGGVTQYSRLAPWGQMEKMACRRGGQRACCWPEVLASSRQPEERMPVAWAGR